MSIDWCKNCDHCVEGSTIRDTNEDEDLCPYCKEPVFSFPEDNPMEDR